MSPKNNTENTAQKITPFNAKFPCQISISCTETALTRKPAFLTNLCQNRDSNPPEILDT